MAVNETTEAGDLTELAGATGITGPPPAAEVVIVGAGVAGLYCAYRLLTEGKATNVVIVERLNRFGGRLDTDLIKILDAEGNVDTVRDEEGAMRFNFGMHQLMALNGALGLCDQLVPFPMAPVPPNTGGFAKRYFMRSTPFSTQTDGQIWSELYNLSGPKEEGKTPGDILGDIFNALLDLPANKAILDFPVSDPTPEDWQTLRLQFTWNGVTLNEWQLSGLIRDMGYSEECITMLTHALGFEGPFLSLANAGEAMQILEDFPQPDFYTFREGYSTLTNKLASEVERLGGKIFVGVNVETIETNGSMWNLDLTVAPPYQSSSRFVPGGVRQSIQANKVILAVASKALADLYASSPVFYNAPNAEQLWDDIESVVNMRLLKINLYFKESWWESITPPVQYGPSFTDLPINSIYPFYSLAGPSDPLSAGALTIYCDFNNTNFWQGLQNVGPKFTSPDQESHNQEKPQVIFAASQAVVDEALKQIAQLFGIESVPDDVVMTSYRLWGGESDFGYAYHQWAMNADDAQVMPRLAQPVPGLELYACNEAYSDDQGWVNGSLRSADCALWQGFEIPGLPLSGQCKEPPPPPS